MSNQVSPLIKKVIHWSQGFLFNFKDELMCDFVFANVAKITLGLGSQNTVLKSKIVPLI